MPIAFVDGKEIEVDAAGKPVVVPDPAAPAVEPVPAVVPAPEPTAAPEPVVIDRTVPLPALLDERGKRQDAERELAEAQTRLAEFERLRMDALARTRSQPIDYNAIGSYEDLGRAIEQRNDYEFAAVKTALSKEVARLRYPDFESVLSESGILADLERDSVLANYIASQPMPAVTVYQLGLARVAPKRLAAAKAAGEAAGAKKVAEQIVKAAEAPVTLANAPASSAPAPTGLTLDKAAELGEAGWAALSPDVKARLLRGEQV